MAFLVIIWKGNKVTGRGAEKEREGRRKGGRAEEMGWTGEKGRGKGRGRRGEKR